MRSITFDTKLFDYNSLKEDLVAVPKSLLRDYIKLFNKNKKTNEAEWVLTKQDILNSVKDAKDAYKKGELIEL